MDVFIVLCDDRHCDMDTTVFATEEDAISSAKLMLKCYVDELPEEYRGEIEEERTNKPDWLYYARWNEEGESIRVVREGVIE